MLFAEVGHLSTFRFVVSSTKDAHHHSQPDGCSCVQEHHSCSTAAEDERVARTFERGTRFSPTLGVFTPDDHLSGGSLTSSLCCVSSIYSPVIQHRRSISGLLKRRNLKAPWNTTSIASARYSHLHQYDSSINERQISCTPFPYLPRIFSTTLRIRLHLLRLLLACRLHFLLLFPRYCPQCPPFIDSHLEFLFLSRRPRRMM